MSTWVGQKAVSSRFPFAKLNFLTKFFVFCSHYSRKYPIQLTIKNLSPLSRQDAEFTFDEVAEATSTSGTTAWEPDSPPSVALDQKSTADIDFATTIMYSDVSFKVKRAGSSLIISLDLRRFEID